MDKTSTNVYGGIEAGGSKFICAVGTDPTDSHVKRFETTTPQKTIDEVVKFFRPYTVEAAVRRVAVLAGFLKKALGMKVIQVVGDPDMKCSRVGILVGGGSLGLGIK
jgi:hypothetical protein